MLSDYLREELARCLTLLEKDSATLSDLVTPGAPARDGLGQSGRSASSRPPVSIPILDLKVETEQLLGLWCGQLRVDAELGRIAPHDSIALRASWLRSNIGPLVEMPWAQLCAEEIIAQAYMVNEVVAPPQRVDDPSPIEQGTVREIVAWARHLRREVSRSTVQRWIKNGLIPHEVAPDGRVIVTLADVLEHAPLALRWNVGH